MAPVVSWLDFIADDEFRDPILARFLVKNKVGKSTLACRIIPTNHTCATTTPLLPPFPQKRLTPTDETDQCHAVQSTQDKALDIGSRPRGMTKPMYLPPHLRVKRTAELIHHVATAEPTSTAAGPDTKSIEVREQHEATSHNGQTDTVPDAGHKPTIILVDRAPICAPYKADPSLADKAVPKDPSAPTIQTLITPPATRSSAYVKQAVPEAKDLPKSPTLRNNQPSSGVIERDTTIKSPKAADNSPKPRSRKRKPARHKPTVPVTSNGWLRSKDIPRGLDPKKVKANWKWLDAKSRLSGWLTNPSQDRLKDSGNVKIVQNNIDWCRASPPALDWDKRPQFHDDALAGRIDKWIHGTYDALLDYETSIDLMSYNKALASKKPADFPAYLLRSIVPVYWKPDAIEQSSANLFWNKLKDNKKLKTVDDGDLDRVDPWWEQFPPYNSPLMQDYHQPEIAGIDPDETNAQRKARRNDHGSDAAIERIRKIELKKAAMERLKRRQNTPGSSMPEGVFRSQSHLHTLHRKQQPKIFIRAANREDMPQVCAIYNYYIKFSVVIDEAVPLTEHTITERWRKAQLAGLPMLVACEEAYKIKDCRKAHRGTEVIIPDRVVGMAFASDYSIRREAYKYTKRVQVFTHVEHYKRGIAKALMDKLLMVVDGNYAQQTDFPADIEIDRYGPKPAEIRSLVINYLYDNAAPEKFNSISDWLTRMYQFGPPAIVPHAAWKDDKELDLAIFQRDIGLEVQSSCSGSAMSQDGAW